MKVAVYTIAKNETLHAERWARSAEDADYRIVADTGSTDDTVDKLTGLGVKVAQIGVRPWRFDIARNTAMALIPEDVDVCCTLDMDMFLEPGWRDKLETAWAADTTALYCRMILQASDSDPTPIHDYPAKNFHSRSGYRFKRAAHEALFYDGEEKTDYCRDLIVRHSRKNASDHSSYIELMEVSHREDPNDAQICFWLAREHMWRKQDARAVELFETYLGLPASKWRDERSEAMRFLARLQAERKLEWLEKARQEAPHRREIWLDLAEHFHGQEDWLNLFWACCNGLQNTRRTGSYLDDAQSWGFRLFDLAAIGAWRLNVMDRAVEWGRQALELDPGNGRLRNNLDFFLRRREEVRVGA